MPRTKARTLSIFLIKEEHTEPRTIFKQARLLPHHPVQDGRATIGELYLQPSHIHPPGWLGYFRDTIPDINNLHSASAAGVLLIRRQQRLFAVTFGYGRNLLNPGVWEENFGLRVTINTIDPEKIRSIDRKSFDTIGRHTREQAAREASVGAFGIDIEQDLLRAVTGEPDQQLLGTRMSGMDALSVTTATTITLLPEQLEAYLAKYQSNEYRARFSFIDHISEVRDPTVKERLNHQLIETIQAQDFEHVWLTTPEVIDWSDVQGFRYRHGQEPDPDLHITRYLREKVPDLGALSIERCKRHAVDCISATTEQSLYTWPVYKCLNAELESGGSTYLLSSGSWYRIDTAFAQRINDAVAQIPPCALPLPAYHDQSETAYNQRIATEYPEYALLDRDNVIIGGAGSRVEICDLYHQRHVFVHVKHYAASSVLSHLFQQGQVSGVLFAGERPFREAMNQKLPVGHRLADPAARPTTSEYEIVFAVISRSTRPLKLPFFSRVSLRYATRQLTTLGYRVSIAKIQA